METRIRKIKSGDWILFKSYYVVWKHKFWKKPEETNILFKSYYVVWKLILSKYTEPVPDSLNRTMQYGNKS